MFKGLVRAESIKSHLCVLDVLFLILARRGVLWVMCSRNLEEEKLGSLSQLTGFFSLRNASHCTNTYIRCKRQVSESTGTPEQT